MNAHTLGVLEYPAMLESICVYAQSQPGISLLHGIHPCSELTEIRRNRPLYADCMGLLTETALDFPSLQAEDLSEILLHAAPEDSVLPGVDLRAVLSFLENVRHCCSFLKHPKLEHFSSLTGFAASLDDFPALCGALERSLDRDGSLLDNASETLANIRRHTAALSQRIQKNLEEMLRQEEWADTFQEKFVTMRNGRYVVPVRRDTKKPLPGVVHDLSHSGATLFLEPSATLGMGNDLSRSQAEERDEERRILAALTTKLRGCIEGIREDQRIFAALDAAMAIARWAQVNGCILPVFSGELLLRQARHPLLQIQFRQDAKNPRKVVPLDFSLPPQVKTLAVTGSNTGGKTVALKTIGLLCLAAQSGLPVPAAEGSTFPIFDQIFADIGDEQSLEENLSTFSAHMARYSRILPAVRQGKNLVLLDELGSGTDPTEGGALACAILDALAKGDVLTVATTHLSMVKTFVHSRKDMKNGAVRFDIRTLQPEYVLEIGRPGASHAIHIARKLGLPKNVLDKAEKFLSPNERKLEELLAKVEADQRRIAAHEAEAAKLETSLRKKEEELQKSLDALRKERKQMLLDAHQQAEAVVTNTRRDVENLVRKIRENAKSAAATEAIAPEKLEKVHRVLEQKAQKLREGVRMRQERPEQPIEGNSLVIGRRVWVEKLHAHGVIEEICDGGKKATVQLNGIPFTLAVKELQLAKDGRHAEPPAPPVVRVIQPIVEGRTAMELNLIGMRVEEALVKLAEFIDRSAMARMPEVVIVHGFGTGKLRNAVQQWLARCPAVREFHLHRGNENERDNAGCTIVHFSE